MTEPLLLVGDCRKLLPTLPDNSVHMCMTSPPYWGLRDYALGDDGIGVEETLEKHLENLVGVFREVRRVLRDDGTLWLNYGDRYNSAMTRGSFGDQAKEERGYEAHGKPQPQLKMHAKNLIGLPWRVAFALQDDGWILRSDIIHSKPNPMPDSVRDRPTCAHEYLFLFAVKPKYFYDQEAIREEHSPKSFTVYTTPTKGTGVESRGEKFNKYLEEGPGRVLNPAGRNKRTVWTIPTQPTPEAHFATFSEKLVEPCLLAGTSERGCCAGCGAPVARVVERSTAQGERGKYARSVARQGLRDNPDRDFEHNYVPKTRTTGWQRSCSCDTEATEPCVVLDPFFGSGTVGRVADRLGRTWVGIEMNEEYVKIAKNRTQQTSLLARCHDKE